MAGRADILAGRSYVELLLKDENFAKGLDAAGKKFQAFGKGMAIVGGAITGAGLAITGPLIEMTREFAATAAGLFDMSARTHESVASLEFLGYAAQETGTDIEKIQQAIFKTQKSGKNFDQIAAQIASIQDPAKQSQAAIEAFGKKAGPFLVPLLRQLPELKARFNELGLAKGLSDKDVATGKKLNSTFIDLMDVVKSARNVIGAALAPTVQAATDVIIGIAKAIRDWIDDHRQLFVTLLKVGAGLVAAGAAITALGLGFTLVGSIVSGFAAAIGVVGAVLGAIISPVGLLVAGIAGLATWFATSTDAGQAMVQSLVTWFGELKDVAVDTFGGISDALSAGDLALAAKVAWTGVKEEFFTALLPIAKAWDTFIDGFTKRFGDAIKWVVGKWQAATKAIANFILEDAAKGGVLGKAALAGTGVDISKEQARAELLRQKDIEAKQQQLARLQEMQSKGQRDTMDDGTLESVEAQSKRIEDLRSQLASLNATPVNILGDMEKDAGEQLDGMAKKMQDFIDHPPSVADAFQDQIDDAKAKLAELKKQAADEKKKISDRVQTSAAGGSDMMSGDNLKSQIFSTFSAAAVVAGGAGQSSPVVNQLKLSETAAQKRHDKMIMKMDQMWRAT